jgi:mono/diheme cytochrome c family protein
MEAVMNATRTSARLLMLAALAALTATPAVAQPTGAGLPDGSQINGESVFKTYCASCHGESGRGNGAVAIFLRTRPADLTQIAIRNKGTFPAERVYKMIDGRQVVKPHGESQMPVWGDAFAKSATESDERAIKAKIDALVEYLESIQERPSR